MMGLSANAIFCILSSLQQGLGLKEVALEKERLRAIHY